MNIIQDDREVVYYENDFAVFSGKLVFFYIWK